MVLVSTTHAHQQDHLATWYVMDGNHGRFLSFKCLEFRVPDLLTIQLNLGTCVCVPAKPVYRANTVRASLSLHQPLLLQLGPVLQDTDPLHICPCTALSGSLLHLQEQEG